MLQFRLRPRAVTEAELLASVLELARLLGIFAYHTHDSRRSQAGFPDLVLAGNRGLVFAELKSESGRLSREQVAWRWQLEVLGQAYRIWRPRDWHNQAIRHELEAIR